jgi:hypothetical protein
MGACCVCQRESTNYLYVTTRVGSGTEERGERLPVCGEHMRMVIERLRRENASAEPRIFSGAVRGLVVTRQKGEAAS